MTYQWEVNLKKKPSRKLSEFEPQLGYSRYKDQYLYRIYTEEYKKDVFLVGDFSDWKPLEEYKFKKNRFFSELIFDLPHKTEYLIWTEGKFLRDPASRYFSDKGNSIFWKFDSNKSKPLNLLNSSLRILQTDLPGLIVNYEDKKGRTGAQIKQNKYYEFIEESGVIDKISKLNFNAIQFLPLSQSIDGDNWKFRYLTPFIGAINKNFGSPRDFKKMIDEFHKKDIGVIMDLVISHAPHKQYKIFELDGWKTGISYWDKVFSTNFLGDETSWGTKRYNLTDPIVRRFIIDQALSLIKNYNIDGFRIDNIDGILRFGENGDGAERAFGRKFLREFVSEIYAYKPEFIINYESHFFKNDNAKLLVQSLEEDKKALGATAYTSSRLTYYLHSEFMPKSADDISPWKIKHINDEKEWGESNSTIADFHNHDAAAGLMHGRATGSYAYDAITLGNCKLNEHAIGKIKVMEAIISFACEGMTLDLLQTFLLQTGTFEHDTSVNWKLEDNSLLDYKKNINKILESNAFNKSNLKNRNIINIDENSKTIVIERSSSKDYILILINMSAFESENFVIPSKYNKPFEVHLDSSSIKYLGNKERIPRKYNTSKTDIFEYFKYGVEISRIEPYQVLVLKKTN